MLDERVSPIVVTAGKEEQELEPQPEPQPLLILEPSITEGPDEKDLLIESLRQIMALRTELQSFKREAQKVVIRRRQEESWSQNNANRKNRSRPEQAYSQVQQQVEERGI